RADGQRRWSRDEDALRPVDDRHGGRQPLGALRAYGRDHRRRADRSDSGGVTAGGRRTRWPPPEQGKLPLLPAMSPRLSRAGTESASLVARPAASRVLAAR